MKYFDFLYNTKKNDKKMPKMPKKIIVKVVSLNEFKKYFIIQLITSKFDYDKNTKNRR